MSSSDVWATAPSWANYRAQEPTGEWWWYQNKPIKVDQSTELRGHPHWRLDGGFFCRQEDASRNWAETLEGRPK